MKSLNTICMSVLMLGAAAIAVPAMAQAADNNASAAESAQAAPSNTQANDSAPAAGAAAESSQAADASAAPSTKTAMNSGNAAANADVSSVGTTSKKYHRASRARDFAAEKKITEQLNQQASIAAKPTSNL